MSAITLDRKRLNITLIIHCINFGLPLGVSPQTNQYLIWHDKKYSHIVENN